MEYEGRLRADTEGSIGLLGMTFGLLPPPTPLPGTRPHTTQSGRQAAETQAGPVAMLQYGIKKELPLAKTAFAFAGISAEHSHVRI